MHANRSILVALCLVFASLRCAIAFAAPPTGEPRTLAERNSPGDGRLVGSPFSRAPEPVASNVQALGVLPDAYEPDDSTSTAHEPTWGFPETHTIDATSGHTYLWGDGPDSDWYLFRTWGGSLHSFETSGPADTVVELWDYYGDELIAWSDNKDPTHGDFGARVTWTPMMGDYVGYVAAWPANLASGVGTYTFTSTLTPSTILTGTVERLSGPDRYATAEAIANKAFPGMTYVGSDFTTHPVSSLIVVNGADAKAADPLAAAPMAGAYRCPIMLVGTTAVPSSTRRVIEAIKAGNGGKLDLYVVGGTLTVPSTIYSKLAALKGSGGTILRIGGSNRYDLAAKIADRVSAYWLATHGHQPPRIFLSNGEITSAFWDALAAGPAMYRTAYPLLLFKTLSVPTATKSRYNGAYHDSSALVLNIAWMSSSAADVFLGGGRDFYYWAHSRNRTDAAYDISRWSQWNWFVPTDRMGVTNKLADSLTGGVGLGEIGGGLYYTHTASTLSEPATRFLFVRSSVVDTAYILGGPVSITSNVYSELQSLLR